MHEIITPMGRKTEWRLVYRPSGAIIFIITSVCRSLDFSVQGVLFGGQ